VTLGQRSVVGQRRAGEEVERLVEIATGLARQRLDRALQQRTRLARAWPTIRRGRGAVGGSPTRARRVGPGDRPQDQRRLFARHQGAMLEHREQIDRSSGLDRG
jgi:hypothetical protein